MRPSRYLRRARSFREYSAHGVCREEGFLFRVHWAVGGVLVESAAKIKPMALASEAKIAGFDKMVLSCVAARPIAATVAMPDIVVFQFFRNCTINPRASR